NVCLVSSVLKAMSFIPRIPPTCWMTRSSGTGVLPRFLAPFPRNDLDLAQLAVAHVRKRAGAADAGSVQQPDHCAGLLDGVALEAHDDVAAVKTGGGRGRLRQRLVDQDRAALLGPASALGSVERAELQAHA